MVAQITQLPPAPQRSDAPVDFVAKADAHVASLTQFVNETNLVVVEMNDAITLASGSAASAGDSAAIAEANANFKGEWSSLTGALSIPAAALHNSVYWQLITNLADVTASEPGVTGDWTFISNISVDTSRAKTMLSVNINKAANGWGAQAPFSVLGDSISHGAFAGDLFYHGWTRILARMLSGDFGGLSYQGFVPLLTLSGTGPSSKDIHNIQFSGTWGSEDSSTSANGAAAYNGIVFQSTAVNDFIATTIPPFQDKALVWYLQQPGGGELTIRTNYDAGTDIVIDTNGTLQMKAQVVAVVDNKQGRVDMQAFKTDATTGPVAVAGFGYIEGLDTPTVHNFSQSGRRLRYVDESVISDLTSNAGALFMALGGNDQGDVDANPAGAYALAFKQRIDWVIQYCNANDTFLVIPDFCWSAPDDSFTRKELQRAVKATGGLYIPLPNLMATDGEVRDFNYRVSTLNTWADATHPNEAGHKWIAETVASYLGLSITSKKLAIETNDYWMPLEIPAGVENSNLTADTVSATKINGSDLNYRIAVQDAAAGSFPAGTHTLQNAWRVTPPFSNIGTPLTCPGLLRTDTNVMTSSVTVDQAGSVTLNVTDGTWVNDQIMAAKLNVKVNG